MGHIIHDEWVQANSDLGFERLHAMGVVSSRWSQCELWLLCFLHAISGLSYEDTFILAGDLGDIAIWGRIKAIANARDVSAEDRETIDNTSKYYDACRLNRNSITHAWLRSEATPKTPLATKSKKVAALELSEFISGRDEIRRVADEINILVERLWLLCGTFPDWRERGPEALPQKLAVPDILSKPPPPAQTKPLRQPRASPASPRDRRANK